MSILDRILRRRSSHEDWLAAHPGKGRITMTGPAISDAEQAATRARMEAEMSKQPHDSE